MRKWMPWLLPLTFVIGITSAARSHAVEAVPVEAMATVEGVQVAQAPVSRVVPRATMTDVGTEGSTHHVMSLADHGPINSGWLLGAVALAALCLKRRFQPK